MKAGDSIDSQISLVVLQLAGFDLVSQELVPSANQLQSRMVYYATEPLATVHLVQPGPQTITPKGLVCVQSTCVTTQ